MNATQEELMLTAYVIVDGENHCYATFGSLEHALESMRLTFAVVDILPSFDELCTPVGVRHTTDGQYTELYILHTNVEPSSRRFL